MYVVRLSGDIMRIYNKERLDYLRSLGYFATDSYVRALTYSSCLMNRGKNYRYAEYF